MIAIPLGMFTLGPPVGALKICNHTDCAGRHTASLSLPLSRCLSATDSGTIGSNLSSALLEVHYGDVAGPGSRRPPDDDAAGLNEISKVVQAIVIN